MERKNKQVSAYVGLGVALVICILLVVSIARTIRQKQQTQTKAGTNTATVSLLPATGQVNPNGSVQLWINAANPVAFSHLEVSFNPAHIRLSQEPALTSPQKLSRVVVKTPMAEANTTGKIVFALGLDPANRATPPTGSFQLATLSFTKVSTTVASTAVTVSPNTAQVVNPDTSTFTITAQNSTLALNSTASPTSGTIPGDLTGDNHVDIFDYNLLVTDFGKTGAPHFVAADIDGNGAVDIFDYNILVQNFGR